MKGRREAGPKGEGVNRDIWREEEKLVLKGKALKGIYGGKRRSCS
jgi:hypothetical protein